MGKAEYNREYYKKNKEKIKKKNLDYYEKNRDKRISEMREYYSENRDKLLSQKKEYKLNNPEKLEDQRKRSYEKHKKERLRKQTEYNKKRWSENEEYRVTHNIRRRIRHFIDSQGASKNKKTESLIGCSYEELIDYLYSKGHKKGFHIDHYVPLSLFDVFNEDHKKIMFNYRNMRPIHKKENSKKWRHLPEDWEEHIKYLGDSLSVDY